MLKKMFDLIYYYVKMYFFIIYKYMSYSNHLKNILTLSNAKRFVTLHEKFDSHYLFISNFFK